ncbi:carboxyl transferase domain-containing protein [Micromonospora sp. BRA006-A]|nr:carboxyl transferase domain-containing protein [Micromonospora sp. BRA006-A]
MAGSDFATVGEIFSATANPDRKKPFDIRTVMRALADQDHPVLERWAGMADAETAVVQDVHLGGIPVCLLGIESRSVPRHGFPPTDGPDTYTAGTLFPRSSKKAARAITTRPAATGRLSCSPTCPASTARPSRCASCNWSTARRSAGRSSTSAARSCSA